MKPLARRRLQEQAPLPVRDGVAPSRVYLPEGHWATLLDFLQQRFVHVAPHDLLRRLHAGDIVDGSGRAQTPDSPYVPGQWLWYYRDVPAEVSVPFALTVLYRDDYLVAVDKPHFLASVPGGAYLHETALTRLRKRFSLPTLTPLHRLDRDTAGVLLFCADPPSRGLYQGLFQSRQVDKLYEAIVYNPSGRPVPEHCSVRLEPVPGQFTVQVVPGVANSVTRIDCLRQWRDPVDGRQLAHVQLRPETGRKHQLRAHLAWLGLPIVNDVFYPQPQRQRPASDFSQPLQLLARRIAFTDPHTGRQRVFESVRQLDLLPQGGRPQAAGDTG